nr:facilitated trehalose transporter Tret1-like [Penaeus vannamei]
MAIPMWCRSTQGSGARNGEGRNRFGEATPLQLESIGKVKGFKREENEGETGGVASPSIMWSRIRYFYIFNELREMFVYEITSVPMLICVPGSVAGGALTERVGPRRLQMALCPVLALAFLGMPAAAWVCARESDYLQGLLILCRVIQVKVLPFGISSFRIYVLHLMSHIAPLAHRPDEADLNCMLYIACFWTVTSIACFKLHVSGLILSLVNQTTMHLKRPWPFSQTVQSGRSLGPIYKQITDPRGLVVALLYPAVHIYPCEIADPRRRGTLGSLIQVWASIGYLLCYVLGRYLSWISLAVALPMVTLLPGFLGLTLAPESPLWLARQGKPEEARAALQCLRVSEEEVSSAICAVVQIEEDRTQLRAVLQSPQKKMYFVPILVSVMVFVMTQFTGQIVISANAVRIFRSAEVGLSPSLSSILVGTTRLTFCAMGSLLLYRVPRKTLLVAGNAVAGVALLSIATFFFMRSREYDTSGLNWLPLGSLMLYMVAFSIGIGPASSLLHVEVLPGPVRSVGSSVAATCFFASIFLVTKTFDDVEAAFGLHSVFYAYALGCAVFCILVISWVPETKDRSLGEIENIWKMKYGDFQTEATEASSQVLLPKMQASQNIGSLKGNPI